MKKIIAKNYYKICILIIIIYICICFIPNMLIKAILFILGIIIFSFLKLNHSKAFNEINNNFFTQKHLIDKGNEKYLSGEEETALYDKIYNAYFQEK